MRCLSCNANMSDREANRKYLNWREIKNPEARYIGLCDICLDASDMDYVENPLLDNTVEREVEFKPDQEQT
jgi:hypothetical protein